jgi:hypothetical protein
MVQQLVVQWTTEQDSAAGGGCEETLSTLPAKLSEKCVSPMDTFDVQTITATENAGSTHRELAQVAQSRLTDDYGGISAAFVTELAHAPSAVSDTAAVERRHDRDEEKTVGRMTAESQTSPENAQHLTTAKITQPLTEENATTTVAASARNNSGEDRLDDENASVMPTLLTSKVQIP